MSGQQPAEYSSSDPTVLAKQAEQDLNSHAAKVGHHGPGHEGKGASDSTKESLIDQSATRRFPGATAQPAPAASGSASHNTEIPPEEGGGLNPATGRTTKARDFEGPGGPEDKMRVAEAARPGDDDVRGNVRQGGDEAGVKD